MDVTVGYNSTGAAVVGGGGSSSATAPLNSTEHHDWYLLVGKVNNDVDDWLDNQNQIVLSIAICFIGLWIMLMGERTLQIGWLIIGIISGFIFWYVPITQWYLPDLADPQFLRIVASTICGIIGGWLAYLFRLGALFIVNFLLIAPLTFILLTALIDVPQTQDWLQVRLGLSLLVGMISSAAVVKGRKIGLRAICVLSGSFLVASMASFLAQEIDEKDSGESPILWRTCLETCLADGSEVLSTPSDAEVRCVTLYMVWTILAASVFIFEIFTRTKICCMAKREADNRVRNSTALNRPLLNRNRSNVQQSAKSKWVPQCCVEFWYSLKFCGLRVIPTCIYTIYYACGGCLRVFSCIDSTQTNIRASSRRWSNSIPPPAAPQNYRNHHPEGAAMPNPSPPSFGNEVKPAIDLDNKK